MSARETLPLQCSSPSKRDDDNGNTEPDFKSFNNPALGISVSCSLAQLENLKQMLTPASADQAQQAPFFTPFSNKTYDTALVSDSVVFYSAMETGLRSSQSVNADPNGSVQSRRLLAKTLVFGDVIPTGCAKAKGSRPSSNGLAMAAKPVNLAAVELEAAAAVKVTYEEATDQATIATHSPVTETAAPLTRELHRQTLQADIVVDDVKGVKVSIGTQDPANTNADVQPECSAHAASDSTPSRLPGDSSCLAEMGPIVHSPANSDELTMQALIPTAFLLDNLLEGSGETNGNSKLTCPRVNRKPSPGPAESTHAQGHPPVIPKREKSYGAGACTPRPANAGAAPSSVSTARKISSAATPSRRQRTDVRDTPAPSAKLPSSCKQSQARTAKASTTAATTPGQQSSQKPRRPSTVAVESSRDATLQVAGHTTPPRSASKTGASVPPAAWNASDAKAARVALETVEDQVAAGTGTGTPFCVKRVRPALGASPPVTPFSAMKCPPAARGQAGGTNAAILNAPAAGARPGPGSCAATGKAQALSEPQRAKRSIRAKAAAAAPAAAKSGDSDTKAGQEAKASAAGGGRSNAGGDASGTRRNSSVSGAAKATKATAAHAAPTTAKVALASVGTRGAAAHATKHASAPGKESRKQVSSKHAAEAVTKSQSDETEFDVQVEAPPVILGRVGAGGPNGTGAAASRYGKPQHAALDPSPLPTERGAACHSPDKLPPSKRHAVPITSPSKRQKQERNASAPTATPPAGAPARAVSAGGRAGAPRGNRRAASSPAARGAIAAKGKRSRSAHARRPRSSLPGTAAEQHVLLHAPLQFTLGNVTLKIPALPLPSLAPAPPQGAEPPAQLKHIPKLDFDILVPCKSPLGTPHLRTPGAAVTADLVPLRHQPVSTRSPVLAGGAATPTRRLSLSSASPTADLEPGAPSPVRAVAEAKSLAASVVQGPCIADKLKQVVSHEATRSPPSNPVRLAAVQPSPDPPLGGAGKAKAVAIPNAAVDGARPPTARHSAHVPVAAAAPRSLSARPSAVHKPLSATGCAGGNTVAAHKGAAAQQPATAGTGKNTKASAAAVPAATTAAAAAAKARPPVVHGNRSSDAAAHHIRASEPHGSVAATDDGRNAQRQAPRGGTAAAGPSTRSEHAGRGARVDAEQDRAQRRRQYEALLGRTGPASHAQETSPDAPDITTMPAAGATSAAAPAGKPAVKAPNTRTIVQAPVPQPERLATRKGAPLQPVSGRAAAIRQVTAPAHGCSAPQRGKGAPPAAKEAVSGSGSGTATGPLGSRAVAVRGRADPSFAVAGARASRVPTPDSATRLGLKGGHAVIAAVSSTAQSEEQPVISDGASEAITDACETCAEEDSPTMHPKDLSWLVDSSPYTSIAATPGTLTAARAFADRAGFGFSAAQEESEAPGSDPAPSPSFHAFGASPSDMQVQLGPSPGALGEGSETAGLFEACPGDATVVVRRQLVIATARPVGLPPTGLPAGALTASTAVPSSVFSVRSVQQLTPGPGMFKFPVAAGNRAKQAAGSGNNNGATPAVLPQAKLRFSWDPAAAGVSPAPPGVYACHSPGMADSFLGFGTAAVQGATPVSIPNPGAFGVDRPEPGGKLEGAGALGDADNQLDQDLGNEVPVPLQCTSPNTPVADAFGPLVLGGGAGEGDQSVVMFGAGGGIGRAGRVVQDSFDALRISSMSSWPMLRDREAGAV